MSEAQGVAQRVISKAREGYQQVRSVAVAHDQSTVIKLNRLDAMEELCAEFSAEARRVLAETWSKPDNCDPHTQMAEWVAQKDLAERLGLNLNEPEDSDE